jgi:hypothetical protein
MYTDERGLLVTDIDFEPWPKIARLNRNIVVTEKIDGTNAAVIITEDGKVGAQSRTRLITLDQDNYGFARWVFNNRDALTEILGPGRHFGEWWGAGIQRRYGLGGSGAKRFSLFNTGRWTPERTTEFGRVEGLGVVPVLYQGPFDQAAVNAELDKLARDGSVAAPGFMDPEGIVVYVAAAQQMFKVTIKGDEAPKSLAEAA